VEHLGHAASKAAEREELLRFPDLIDFKHVLNFFLHNAILVVLGADL